MQLASLIHRLRDTGEGFSFVADLRISEGYHTQRRRIELSEVCTLTDDGKPVSDIVWARDVSLGEEDRHSLLVRLRAVCPTKPHDFERFWIPFLYPFGCGTMH